MATLLLAAHHMRPRSVAEIPVRARGPNATDGGQHGSDEENELSGEVRYILARRGRRGHGMLPVGGCVSDAGHRVAAGHGQRVGDDVNNFREGDRTRVHTARANDGLLIDGRLAGETNRHPPASKGRVIGSDVEGSYRLRGGAESARRPEGLELPRFSDRDVLGRRRAHAARETRRGDADSSDSDGDAYSTDRRRNAGR